MMLSRILEALDPIIAELLMTLIVTYFGWVIRTFFKSAESQRNLHKALETGVDFASDLLMEYLLGTMSKEEVKTAAISRVVNYVNSSVPDAKKQLKASEIQIHRMATAYVNKRIIQESKGK